MEVLSLDRFLAKRVIVGHVGFIPYRLLNDGDDDNSSYNYNNNNRKEKEEGRGGRGEQVLLGIKDDKIAILGGGCKTSYEESPLDCLFREIGEEINFDIDINNITKVIYFDKDRSALIWYQVADFEQFYNTKLSQEIRAVEVFNWSQICQPLNHEFSIVSHDNESSSDNEDSGGSNRSDSDIKSGSKGSDGDNIIDINEFDGAPEWLTTTKARVVTFRNVCFFHGICSLETILNRDYIPIPYFTTVYLLITTVDTIVTVDKMVMGIAIVKTTMYF
jgi:hypothetical protein